MNKVNYNLYVVGKSYEISDVDLLCKDLSIKDDHQIILKEFGLDNEKYLIEFGKIPTFRYIVKFNFSLFNLIVLKQMVTKKYRHMIIMNVYILSESKVQLENFYYLFINKCENIYFIQSVDDYCNIQEKLLNFTSKTYDGFAKLVNTGETNHFKIHKVQPKINV